jgi:hypothetical protein
VNLTTILVIGAILWLLADKFERSTANLAVAGTGAGTAGVGLSAIAGVGDELYRGYWSSP